MLDNTPDLTPVVRMGSFWVKRDDLWSRGGAIGGKARTCWALAKGARGLVTAGSRASPQINIVSAVAAAMGVPCVAHAPLGALSPELVAAQRRGAEIIQHPAGYNSVIKARARECAQRLGFVEIPFGMECGQAVNQTRRQVANLAAIARSFDRIVVPVGSGMSLAGILWGMRDHKLTQPIVGVVVGADPTARLIKYAPKDWRDRVTLQNAGSDYHKGTAARLPDGTLLDPYYEAKAVGIIRPRDLFWVVGIRGTANG